MKTCPKCFTECENETRFCPNCGANVAEVRAQAEETLIGKTIAGNFLIQKNIGSGAMGSIYLAEQISLGKTVAIKLLHRHLLSDPTLSRRFHREARAASRLNHRNTISIIDFGQAENGALFIAMEYVAGRDLAEVLFKEFPLDYERIVYILKQVCAALDEAHAQGIIHRDLKPENIMLEDRRTEKDVVKVLDFGIAKIQDPSGSEDSKQSWQTVAGVVCGTPEYMSPEQARGEKLDARSDIYSLGIILYQLLTNSPPYGGDSPIAVVTKHLTEPIPNIENARPGVNRDLAGLARRLMQKDRARRPESAMRVHRELEKIEKNLALVPSSTMVGSGAFGGRQIANAAGAAVEMAAPPRAASRPPASRALGASDSHDSVTKVFGPHDPTPNGPAAPPQPAGTEIGLELDGLEQDTSRMSVIVAVLAAAVLIGTAAFVAWRVLRPGSPAVAGSPYLVAAEIIPAGEVAGHDTDVPGLQVDPGHGDPPSTTTGEAASTDGEGTSGDPAATDGAATDVGEGATEGATGTPQVADDGGTTEGSDPGQVVSATGEGTGDGTGASATEGEMDPGGTGEVDPSGTGGESTGEGTGEPTQDGTDTGAADGATEAATDGATTGGEDTTNATTGGEADGGEATTGAATGGGTTGGRTNHVQKRNPSGGRSARLRELEATASSAKRAGNWTGAISAYQAAYKLRANRKYLKEIGYAYVKLHNQSKACGYFEKYVRRFRPNQRVERAQRFAVYGCDFQL